MKKRWVFGGAALALGLLTTVGAWPASADAPAVNFTSPSPDESVKEQVVIHGEGHMPNGGSVTSMRVRLDSAGGHDIGWVDFVGSAFHWTPDVPFNGVYTAVATATGRDNFLDQNLETSPEKRVTFKVERPPVPPSGVDTSVDETKRVVTINWNANPEPDLLGYLVSRQGKGVAFVRQGTKFDDALKDLPAGDYEYAVQAVREDANPNDTIALHSAPSTSTAKVKSAPTVALSGNPTTTAPKSTSGSSGSGSSGARSPSTNSSGRVNLSSYSNLLPDQSELPLARSDAGPAPDDEGFDGELPFAAGSSAPSVVSGEDAAEALNGEPLSSTDDSRPESLLFLAAGLLVTVILMHVLWIKSEVDRVPLEPLAPEVAVKP